MKRVCKSLYTLVDCYNEIGISPPEFIGKDVRCTEFILNELRKRNVIVRETIQKML